MGSRDYSKIIAGLALAAPIPYVAHAETYLSENQAASVLFPGTKLEARWMELSPDEASAIAKAAGERVLDPRVRVLWGPNREAVIIDRVVGKHEFITYAVAVSSAGAVKGVEIMDYRETFGSEVRRPEWRAQFSGKTSADKIKIGKDIRNISGATLSSVHVTNGVRRVLQTYAVLKAKA
jgi:hypothetical protein